MTIYNFAATNGTNIIADDAHWTINTNGFGTCLCNGSNQGKCGANGAQPTRYYQNAQGSTQTCQLVLFPATVVADGRNLSTQMTTTTSGYSIRTIGGAATTPEYRRAGVFVQNITGGPYNTFANTYTIKITTDASGNVNAWLATGNVADAQVSGSNVLSVVDGSPITGGFPGFFLTEATVGNAPIGTFNDFASVANQPFRRPRRVVYSLFFPR